ncbi:Neuromedin-U receptor 1 [Folsomia candida]|uniref:Neuromedin-U receptor 1 n=1 Tax=Folsomia candida TaxID=158441 RepID=A0A226E6F1_FOLCA|nr:Neuromedin-U receptor 1 [Folsomia candida]
MDGIPPSLLLEPYPPDSYEEEDRNRDLVSHDFVAAGSSHGFLQYMSKVILNFSDAESNLNSIDASGTLLSFTNLTDDDTKIRYPDFSQVEIVRVIFICLFVLESVIGVMGNFFVCLTVYRNKSMHSPVNYYIVNLGICDFLVGAVVLPVKLFELTADADINMMTDFWCTAVRFLETIVVFASVFTLVAICFERYNAVVYPVQSRINMTNLRIRRVLTVVWIIPGLVAAPNLYPATSVSQSLYSHFGEFTRVTCFDGINGGFRCCYSLFDSVQILILKFTY